MEEQVIYQDQNTLISTARIVILGTTYSTANVTSVKVITQHEGVLLMLLGIVAAAIGLTQFHASSITLAVVLLLVGAGLLYWGSRLNFAYLIFHSASGEIRALKSSNRPYVHGVQNAISEAIIRRG